MKIINPTGGKLRSDSAGHGAYGSRRGKRKHKGKDYEALVGQFVYSPIGGVVERYSRPYVDDLEFSGMVISGDKITTKMFYFQPTVNPGTNVRAGQIIGYAQDITKKHGGTPHIHLETMILLEHKLYANIEKMVLVDPELLEE